MPAREYVRLIYKPAGAERKRTVWAYVVKRDSWRVIYREVTSEGDDTFDGGMQDGLPVVQQKLIIATPAEVRERPAWLNPKYAMLELK